MDTIPCLRNRPRVRRRHAIVAKIALRRKSMPQIEPSYLGLYINLDRSPERRTALEKQLSDLNLHSHYRRFPAVDGREIDTSKSPLGPGEVGLFLSHCRAVEHARAKGVSVHVLEDDA